MTIQPKAKIGRRTLSFYFFVLIGLVLHGFSSLWNVDPYHEGALFPTAVGIAQGLSVFDEINQQYGFLGPLFVSVLVKVFGNYLIIQRLFGLLLIAILFFLFYSNLKRLCSIPTARFIVILWLFVSPVWSWPNGRSALSGGYWPNQIGTMLVLTALLLLHKRESKLNLLFAGIFVFIASQARMEFYFVWFAFVVSVALLLGKRAVFFLLGSFIGISFTFLYLLSQGSVEEWFKQTILVWTLTPPDVPKIGANFFIFNSLNFFGITSIAISLILLANLLNRYNFSTWLKLTFITLITGAMFSTSSLITFTLNFKSFSISSYIRYILENTLFSWVNLTILAFLILLSLFLIKKRFQIKTILKEFGLAQTGIIASCLGTLGLFHNFNPDYSQMVWSLYILGLLVISKKFPILNISRSLESLKLVSIATCLVSFCVFFVHANNQRFPYETQMLKGLYGDSEKVVNELDLSFAEISNYARPRNMLMVCQTGLFSVSHYGYLGSDKWSWNQQPEIMISNRFNNLEVGQTILACKLNRGDARTISQLIEKQVITEIVNNPRFKMYRVMKQYQQLE